MSSIIIRADKAILILLSVDILSCLRFGGINDCLVYKHYTSFGELNFHYAKMSLRRKEPMLSQTIC